MMNENFNSLIFDARCFLAACIKKVLCIILKSPGVFAAQLIKRNLIGKINKKAKAKSKFVSTEQMEPAGLVTGRGGLSED